MSSALSYNAIEWKENQSNFKWGVTKERSQSRGERKQGSLQQCKVHLILEQGLQWNQTAGDLVEP